MNKPTPLDQPDKSQLAQDAFEAHAAMVKQEAANPRLRANEFWRALRDTAFARCRATMEKL